MDATKKRADLLYSWHSGAGVFGEKNKVSEELWRHVAVRVVSESDRMVLTKWMGGVGLLTCPSAARYKGGTPLRISVADKVTTTEWLKKNSRRPIPPQRLAAAGVGAFWGEVRRRWKGATYEEQQEWIQFAPLPPPLTATSLGYFEAVLETNTWR